MKPHVWSPTLHKPTVVAPIIPAFSRWRLGNQNFIVILSYTESKMAQKVKVLVFEFNPGNPNGGRRGPTPECCPVTSTVELWYVYSHTLPPQHKINICNRKKLKHKILNADSQNYIVGGGEAGKHLPTDLTWTPSHFLWPSLAMHPGSFWTKSPPTSASQVPGLKAGASVLGF